MADKGTYCYDYPRPTVTVDAVVFREDHGEWQVVLIRRKQEPFAGAWALPGGFVEMDETLETAAARELEEEAGLRGIALHQLCAFSDPKRDPRGRSISIAFAGLAGAHHRLAAGDDAADARWFPKDALPALAFDHADILRCAIQWMEERNWA